MRARIAAWLDAHASDWRYVHRMWSVWLLCVQAGLNGLYACIGALQSSMTPVQFVVLNVVISVLIMALRVLNQSDVPNA